MQARTLSNDQKRSIEDWVTDLQNIICAKFEEIEAEFCGAEVSGAKFEESMWKREQGGGGKMRLMRGNVLEKAGVNVSTVFGDISESMGSLIGPFAAGKQFWASGISLVVHSKSPLVPSVHMNTRAVCTDQAYWFGGGADLTPTVQYSQDTQDFHAAMRGACDLYRDDSYEKFKRECDEYFFIKHRNEARGVGGIFYDYLSSDSFDGDFRFMQDVGRAFANIYPALVRRRMNNPWTRADKMAQLIKRGKYTEFNLIYDRGTKFGLITGANPEAVLMSLPPEAVW